MDWHVVFVVLFSSETKPDFVYSSACNLTRSLVALDLADELLVVSEAMVLPQCALFKLEVSAYYFFTMKTLSFEFFI